MTDFLIDVNYGPGMARLYAQMLDAWRAAGGTLFTVFVDVQARRAGVVGDAAPPVGHDGTLGHGTGTEYLARELGKPRSGGVRRNAMSLTVIIPAHQEERLIGRALTRWPRPALWWESR